MQNQQHVQKASDEISSEKIFEMVKKDIQINEEQMSKEQFLDKVKEINRLSE